jgi:hypothetical protein
MNRNVMNRCTASVLPLTVAVIAVACAACSSHAIHANPPEKAPQNAVANPHSRAANPTTVRLADDGSAWKKSPHMRAFYDLSVVMLSPGTKIDVDAYEAKSFGIFREFARANGMPEAGMIDHLKLIPRQVVGIVKDDPSVLKSYDAFWIAMVGPD